MHDPVLHIKDSYFFELPKWFNLYHYDKLADVPAYLQKGVTDVKQVNDALAGKILIPQPFGTLKNLYQRESGFCISRFMILELAAAALLVYVFVRLAHKVRGGKVARGSLWNFLEGALEYLRDKVVVPSIGHHDADRFLPLLWTMFFFILTCNLMGLIPWIGTPTAAWGVTFAIAAVTLLAGMVVGMIRFGPIGYWTHYVPHMDLHWSIRIVIFLPLLILELVGMLIRHVVLSIRLLANMVAGHLVLLGVLGLIVAAADATFGTWVVTTIIAVVGSALLCMLELFVAFLQAFVFVFLSSVFIGAAVHEH